MWMTTFSSSPDDISQRWRASSVSRKKFWSSCAKDHPFSTEQASPMTGDGTASNASDNSESYCTLEGRGQRSSMSSGRDGGAWNPKKGVHRPTARSSIAW